MTTKPLPTMNQNQLNAEQQETVRRLRAVTRRIEAFFESQARKLEFAMGQVNDMQSEYDIARRLSADIERARMAWQDERQLEMARLTEASRALEKAWHELEQKQRELEIDRTRTGGVVSNPAAETPVGNAAPVAERVPVRRRAELGLFEMKQLQSQVKQHKRRGR